MIERIHESGRYRKVRLLTGFLLGLTLLAAGTARGQKQSGHQPPSDLGQHISHLAAQLTGVPLDESGPVTDQIEKLAVAYLDQWMANRSPSIAEVQQQIDSVFSKLQNPAYANSRAFRTSWKGSELVGAGYTLGWSDIWRTNVVALYENRNGRSQRVALTNFVTGTDLHYAILPPSASGAFRFIIYGTKMGKSHPRLTAILYSFDGRNLKSLWETQDKFDGKFSIEGDNLVIRYLIENEFIQETAARHLPPQHEAIYKITPQGLELQSDGIISN